MKYKHVILGGTGHIGSALTKVLLQRGESVLVIGHNPDKAADWTKKGAAYEVADIMDSEQLGKLFGQAERLFILNPPAPPSADTVAVETAQVKSILAALAGNRPGKIVAASTYGAQPGNNIADLGVLYELEQGLAALNIPTAIIRSAYYMSNWGVFVNSVQKEGVLPTMFPAGFKLPMVAPEDIGAFAAKLMLNDAEGLHYIEGTEQYSPRDVARSFSELLQKPVRVLTIPETDWSESLKKQGFSDSAAQSFINMTKLTLTEKFEAPNAIHGATTIYEYISRILSD